MNAASPLPRWWTTACTELAGRDPRLAPLIDAHPPMRVGTRGDAFQTLARSIIGQQVSVKAAQSVWTRFATACGEVSPAVVVRADPAMLRTCGLSGRKVQYIGDLARHFLDRPGGVDDWAGMDDAGIIAELTAVRGIGIWTAQMFLIFHLARPDVLPLGDLGLRRAIELRYSRSRPTSVRTLARLSTRWQPWRTVATWYLWRSLEPDPVLH
jgi:DNA-3-methyladenine glycosylase II